MITFSLNSNNIAFYTIEPAMTIISALSKIGGLLAILKISTLLSYYHRLKFDKRFFETNTNSLEDEEMPSPSSQINRPENLNSTFLY